MNLQQIIQSKKQLLLIASRYGASNMSIFGSIARGEEGPDSDVDFLVDMDDNRDLLDLIGLQEELSKEIGLPVDVVTRASLNRHIKDRVLQEAMDL